MNTEQHLLIKVMEECAEIIKEASKTSLFGFNDYEPEQHLSNQEKLENEICDLFSVIDMLVERGLLRPEKMFDSDKVHKKQAKVIKWMKHSVERGRTHE